MNLKKIQKFLITAIIAIGLSAGSVTGSVTAASADATGGGTGGGSGGSGTQSGFYWASVSSSSTGTAYNQFLNKSGWSRSFAEAEASRRTGNISICQNSDVIWFLMGPQVWAYNFAGYPTWDTHWMFRGSIQYPQSLFGPAPTAAQYQHFIDWDNGIGGMRRDNPGTAAGGYGYTIICSYATFRTDQKRYTTEVTTSPPTTVPTTYTKPYSWTTEITRQPITGGPAGKSDPIGADNLHDQSLVTQKTNFGLYWDSVAANSSAAATSLTAQQLKNGADAALAKDQTLAHGTTALDAANKAGMAEGGVLNVKEQTKYATITVNETSTTTTTKRCTYTKTWNSYWGAYNAETSSCSSSSSTSISRTAEKVAGTQQNTGFWQMLAVHCNKAEFDALLASDSSLQKINTPDPTNAMSGSVVTKNYGTQPAKLDFGDSTNANAAKAKTGNLAFFDKECPFDCTPSKATSDGASNNNGAVGNVGSAGVASPALFGAKSDTANTNAFEFFRDNAAKPVTVDTWYPKAVNGVGYAGEAPLTTTITRDPSGTPSLDGSSGGKFTMNSAKGDALFGGAAKAVTTQKNWDSSTFSSPTATILKGLHNSFNLKATWASDANKPQAFNFKWEYAPSVQTTVPLSGIGFSAGSAQSVGTKGSAATAIEGKCYSFFGTTTSSSTVAEFGANTGTGTVNKLDGALLTGTKGTAAKLTANFVRSTTE
jgi:hypothetical protein